MIVSRLSAYRRKNRTKRAVWEFDKLSRTLKLSDFIESPVLRHKALLSVQQVGAITASYRPDSSFVATAPDRSRARD